jgi:hypothetical protein
MSIAAIDSMSFSRRFPINGCVHVATVTGMPHGWDVVEHVGCREIRRVHLEDWHKVEVALMLLEIRARGDESERAEAQFAAAEP